MTANTRTIMYVHQYKCAVQWHHFQSELTRGMPKGHPLPGVQTLYFKMIQDKAREKSPNYGQSWLSTLPPSKEIDASATNIEMNSLSCWSKLLLHQKRIAYYLMQPIFKHHLSQGHYTQYPWIKFRNNKKNAHKFHLHGLVVCSLLDKSSKNQIHHIKKLWKMLN